MSRKRRPPSTGRVAVAAGLVLWFALAGPGLAEDPAGPPEGRDAMAGVLASSASREVASWVRDTGDNHGAPFLVVDKIHAQVLAFDGEGRMLGAAAALLGLARGDVSPPGIGDRPLSAIAPAERITPTGRFSASIGENLGGKGILWIDYAAALSLHPVVTTRASERRLERLASPTADDNRISWGCVNVPAKFYEDVVQPAFAGTTGVVYILPEVRSLDEVFFSAPVTAPAEPDPARPLLD